MGFRRDGRTAHKFSRWVLAHEPHILAAGLPLTVMATQLTFELFLIHGIHPDALPDDWCYRPSTLPPALRSALRKLITTYMEDFDPPRPPGVPFQWPPGLLWLTDYATQQGHSEPARRP